MPSATSAHTPATRRDTTRQSGCRGPTIGRTGKPAWPSSRPSASSPSISSHRRGIHRDVRSPRPIPARTTASSTPIVSVVVSNLHRQKPEPDDLEGEERAAGEGGAKKQRRVRRSGSLCGVRERRRADLGDWCAGYYGLVIGRPIREHKRDRGGAEIQQRCHPGAPHDADPAHQHQLGADSPADRTERVPAVQAAERASEAPSLRGP